MKDSNFVSPGSFLGYEEEFLAGENAYSAEDGAVNADSVGLKQVDSENHEAKVLKASRNIKIVKRDNHVIGVVSMVRQNNVLVNLKEAVNEDGEHFIVHDTNGSLAVFNMMNAYVKQTDDLYRIGDIIRAKVLDITAYGIELETKDPECGVIKAFGIKSRKPLHLIDGVLRDPATGTTENRKISTEYILR